MIASLREGLYPVEIATMGHSGADPRPTPSLSHGASNQA